MATICSEICTSITLQFKQVRFPGVHIWLLHLEHLVETMASERLLRVTVKLTMSSKGGLNLGKEELGGGGREVWRKEKREGEMG